MLPSNVRFLIADTETTGTSEEDKVCEIGWVEVDEDFNIIEQVESLIDPQRPFDPAAQGVHGLEPHDVENSPTIEEFFAEATDGCYGKLIEGSVVLIGHRIGFDRRFLQPYMPGFLQELDTLRWVKRLYPNMTNHQLSTCIYALDLPRSKGAHRVMADVMTAYYLARHLCERTGLTLGQMALESRAPFWVPIMPFGKHKGEPVEEVPRSYWNWMLNNKDMEIDPDLRATAENLYYNKNK